MTPLAYLSDWRVIDGGTSPDPLRELAHAVNGASASVVRSATSMDKSLFRKIKAAPVRKVRVHRNLEALLKARRRKLLAAARRIKKSI